MLVWGPRLKNPSAIPVVCLLFIHRNFLPTVDKTQFWFLDTHVGYLSKILTACRKIVRTSGEWAPIRQQPCCVNLFSKYLAHELLNSPVSWQDFSCINVFSFPRFCTFCTECFAFYHFDCVTVKTNN